MHLDKIDGAPDETVAWGSDIAAQMLRRLGIPYVSLNPGASYRGLHDSLVNHLGNERPGMLLCLHEDHAVAIAHGYAKAAGEPMACVLHSQCRAAARHDGPLQRVVRPRADDRARRDRAARFGEAAAVDRLDPHHARPGRAGALVRQMGRPAVVAAGAGRGDVPRQHAHPRGAERAGLCLPRRRPAGNRSSSRRPNGPTSRASRRPPRCGRRATRWRRPPRCCARPSARCC